MLNNDKKKTTRPTLRLIASSALIGLVALVLSSHALSQNQIERQQELPACPSSPNCVSSQAQDEEHYIAPLQAGSNVVESAAMLSIVLDALPRVEWNAGDDNVIQAAFTTRILRFTDDVLFHLQDDGIIQVRSASRIGRSDFGANRDRVEMLRQKLADLASQSTSTEQD